MTLVDVILEGEHLVKDYVPRGSGLGFLSRRQPFRAVDDVTLRVGRGDAMAIVGESGAGKTTVSRLLARLERPTSGTVRLRGADVAGLRGSALKPFHRQVQIVFQNPYESLDPRHRVGTAVAEPLAIHGLRERDERVEAALEAVGLTPPGRFIRRLPHELSGGQRQRVAIARAIVLGPSVLIADEPVSMLDASIRSSILNLLADLRTRMGLAVVLVTHDLAVARFVAERLVVMYRGHVVEDGPTDAVIGTPGHPYTRLLLAASANRLGTVETRPSGRSEPEGGCRFAARCSHARERCVAEAPALRRVAVAEVRCHFAEEVRALPPPLDTSVAQVAQQEPPDRVWARA